MAREKAMDEVQAELRQGMKLAKCRKCGCMKGTLESLRSLLASLREGPSSLREIVERWLQEMEPPEYECLGCRHCYPAVALNLFHQAFPETILAQSPTCTFEIRDQTWPPVPGAYFAFCHGKSCPVAVSTLASAELAERLANVRPEELCIVGKTETENIGIDKIIKNTITNPTIRFLLLAGKDSEGHRSGRTLLSLWENGVDDGMKVIGSPGRRPILRNVSREEVETFRQQVQVVDMIDCEEVERIVEKLKELSQSPRAPGERTEGVKSVRGLVMPIIQAEGLVDHELDKAGYFVIIPQPERETIIAEHYSYDNKLLRAIEGRDARSIYLTIIRNGWITQLSHAAYLGRELARAEHSTRLGFKYVQDGA